MKIETNESEGVIILNGKTYRAESEAVMSDMERNIIESEPLYTVEYCTQNSLSILCGTEKEWTEVLRISQIDPVIIPTMNWGVYKTGSCIDISDKSFTHQAYIRKIGKADSIIPASLFIEHNQPATVEQAEPKWQSEFEILEFIHPTNVVRNRRFTLQSDGVYKYHDTNDKIELSVLMNVGQSVISGHVLINSIKRKSDYAVFTVGDKVQYSSDVFTISKIKLDQCFWAISESGTEYNCESINPYKPLFTTHDGVDVFEGDAIIYVEKSNGKLYSFNEIQGATLPPNFEHKQSMGKYFKHESNWEEYVVLNAPCLSIQDILDSGEIVPHSPLCQNLVAALKLKVKL